MNMNKSKLNVMIFLGIVSFLFAGMVSASNRPAGKPEKLNFVFFIVDDLGWKDLEVSAEHGKMATQNDDWKEQLRSLKRLCADNGITLWQMHSPLELNVSDRDPERREQARHRRQLAVPLPFA